MERAEEIPSGALFSSGRRRLSENNIIHAKGARRHGRPGPVGAGVARGGKKTINGGVRAATTGDDGVLCTACGGALSVGHTAGVFYFGTARRRVCIGVRHGRWRGALGAALQHHRHSTRRRGGGRTARAANPTAGAAPDLRHCHSLAPPEVPAPPSPARRPHSRWKCALFSQQHTRVAFCLFIAAHTFLQFSSDACHDSWLLTQVSKLLSFFGRSNQQFSPFISNCIIYTNYQHLHFLHLLCEKAKISFVRKRVPKKRCIPICY